MPNQHQQSRGGQAPPSNVENTDLKTQRQHILDLLMAAGGAEVPLTEITVCAAQYNACIYKLRKRGYKIVNRAEMRNGVKYSWYRLESSPTDLPQPAVPSRKRNARVESAPPDTGENLPPLSSRQSSSLPQTLSLFPEMAVPAPVSQRPVWRDPELAGVKNGSVKNGGVKHG